MFKTRLIIVGLVLAIAMGVALFVALLFVRPPAPGAPPKIQSTATIVQQVQTLSELVTVKYVLEKVVILDDIKWYGENRVLLVAHGIVKAGVDLQEIKPEDVRVEDSGPDHELDHAEAGHAHGGARSQNPARVCVAVARPRGDDREQHGVRVAVVREVMRQIGIEGHAVALTQLVALAVAHQHD